MARTKAFDIEEALTKAQKIFWEKGYNGTSIQDLVTGLGINRASIYDTWGNKHALYLATLQLYRKTSIVWLEEQKNSDKTPREIIEAFLNHTVESILLDQENLGCYITNATAELANYDEAIEHLSNENRAYLQQVLVDIIQQGQDAEEFKKELSPRAASKFLFNTITGMRVIGKTKLKRSELEDIIKVALSALV